MSSSPRGEREVQAVCCHALRPDRAALLATNMCRLEANMRESTKATE